MRAVLESVVARGERPSIAAPRRHDGEKPGVISSPAYSRSRGRLRDPNAYSRLVATRRAYILPGVKRSPLLLFALVACSGERKATVDQVDAAEHRKTPRAHAGPIGPERRLPLTSKMRRFDDWAVACDGRTACTALSLPPKRGAEDRYQLLVLRRADWKHAVGVVIRTLGRTPPSGVTLAVGDDVLAAGYPREQRSTFDTVPTDWRPVVSGRRLSVYDAVSACEAFCPPGIVVRYRVPKTGMPPSSVSLRGINAALRYIDRKLGFTGTPFAVVDG